MANKVLLIHNHYGPGGGAETHFLSLVNSLRERGYDTYTFSLSANNENLIPEHDFVYWKNNRPRYWKFWRYFFHPGIYLSLRKVIKRINPDWVHLHVVEQPLSILPALRDQIIIHSVHTAGPVCLTTFLTHKDDLEPCEGGVGIKCLRHHCVSPFIFLPNCYLTIIGNFMLKRNVRAFMTPSENLADHLHDHGFINVRAVPLFVTEPNID